MACQIKRNADGTIAQVLAPNGKDSILYRDIVNNLSNPQVLTQVKQDPYVSMVLGTEYVKGTDTSEVGLAAWSKAYSADFIDQFGNWKTKTITNTDVNGEPSVDALFSNIQASASFKLIQLDEYTKYPQKYSEEVERVVRLIENKLRIKEKSFTGKVSDKFISKENYLADVLKNLLSNIGLPESITSLEELKTQLDSGDVVKYVKSQYDFYKEQASIAKEDLDNLNAKTRTLNSYLKVQDLSGYSKEQQSLIIKSFPALFEELGRYKSKKQALEHYKRIVNTPTFLNKTLSSNIIKNKYFINQAKLNKFENLVNYNTLSPEDFNYRIYRVVENELNRRSDFFSSPKMQEVVLAEKEKIAKKNYENSVKGILERFSNDKNTVSGKIAEVFLRHPKTLSAIKSENIQRSIFGFAGGKWTGNGELEINYRNDTSLKHILLHELTHHFTVPYIYTYLKNYSDVEKYIGFIERFPSKSELEENIQYSFQSLTSEEVKNISKLEDIYIHVLKLHKEGKLKFTNYEFSANPEYGLENFYEFISEVISNPYFASEIAKQPSLYNKKSNLLRDIIDMIFKMFGINNPSLLDDIYSLFEETFLDKDVKYAFRDTIGGSITFPLETQPAVKEGVDFVFEQNPELASIGTQEQYSEYLDTIFPESKMKNIVYHYNSSGVKFDKFDIKYIGSQSLGSQDLDQGFSFVNKIEVAKAFGSFNVEIYTLPEEVWSTLDKETYSKYDKNIVSVVVNPKQTDWKSNQEGWSEFMIKDPNNIHILGSKQDIQSFRNFVSGKKISTKDTIDKIVEQKRWTQTKNNCPKL